MSVSVVAGPRNQDQALENKDVFKGFFMPGIWSIWDAGKLLGLQQLTAIVSVCQGR